MPSSCCARSPGIGQHPPQQRQQALDVVARGQLRHHPTIETVQLDLAEYGVREQAPLAVEHGSGAFVTGGFEGEDFHGGKFRGGTPGKSLPFAARIFRIASPILLRRRQNRR